MKKYIIDKYESIRYNEWNKFIEKAVNGTFLFHRDYMEYHSDRFEDYSLMVYNDSHKLIAVIPANRIDKTFCSHSGLTYGGIVLQKGIYLEAYIILFYELMNYLKLYDFEKIILKPIPNYYINGLYEEVEYLMFLLEAKLIRRDVIALYDISKKNPISRIRNRGIKKGIDNQLSVIQDDNFESFWNKILIPNLNQKYNVNPVHSLEEITYLKSKFPNKILQFNVYYKKEIVAGITIFDMGEVIHPQYVSGITKLNNDLGSLDYLYNELITNYYKDRSYLDFGTSNENMGRYLNKSLHYFKQSFGCETTIQSFYEIDLKNDVLLEPLL